MTSKFHKKEKVTYIDTNDYVSEAGDDYSEEGEANMAKLKHGPPNVCKLLKPSNGKNPVETNKNEKLSTRTYTFDITKYDKTFDLLVKYGQILVPPGLKIPSLEQRKKRDFCKYHNFLGHKTS